MLVSLLHLLVILLAYSSPFWLDWRLFTIGLTLYYLQVLVFKKCVLTYAQYGTFHDSFSARLFIRAFKYFGFKPKKQAVKLALDFYLPLFLILINVVWQLVMKIPVLISLG